MRQRERRDGFTLIELVVVIMIIGILASIALPSYLRSVETEKFDTAVATVNQIGTTNKMFALDHQGYYAAGNFPSGGTCASQGGSCTAGTCITPTPDQCCLVYCNYLSDTDWSRTPYEYTAVSPGTNVASASRRTSGSYGTGVSPYNGWSITMSQAGTITPSGTNVPPAIY